METELYTGKPVFLCDNRSRPGFFYSAVGSGVDMISERGGDQKKKKNHMVKCERKIGKSPTLSKLFTKVIKSKWGSNLQVLSFLAYVTSGWYKFFTAVNQPYLPTCMVVASQKSVG